MKKPPTKPKLLLVGHTYMIAANREKANALAEFFDVCICTSDFENWFVMGEEVRDDQADSRPSFYQLHRLRRWPRTQKYTTIFFTGLNRIVRDFQPNVILVENEPWSFLRWQARFCAWHSAPKAQFAEFTWENVRRPGIKGLVFKIIYLAAARTACKVICGNNGAARLFLDAGLPSDKLHIDGQLGIDEADFPVASAIEKQRWRKSMGWQPDDFVIGFCGRLVEEKGVLELARAMIDIRKVYPNVRLAMLGKGSVEQNLQQIEDAPDWLCILPPVPHLEVYAFLNKLDLFVLPSKPLNQKGGACWEEQFGHVLIEAMTAGVLTIGSDSGAIPEVLKDSQWIFPHSSQEAIAAIILRILKKRSEIPDQIRIQRDQCLDTWCHSGVAKRYAKFLCPATT